MDALGALLAAGAAPPRAAAAAGKAPAKPDNATAARDMEALFAFELVKAMRRTVPESGLLSGGRGEDVVRSIQDQALAQALAADGGLGLAGALAPALDRMDPDGAAGPDGRPGKAP